MKIIEASIIKKKKRTVIHYIHSDQWYGKLSCHDFFKNVLIFNCFEILDFSLLLRHFSYYLENIIFWMNKLYIQVIWNLFNTELA